MTKIVENLILPLVVEEIEAALNTYPDQPYRQAYANPNLRAQLTRYVLNNVPVCYGLVEEDSPAEQHRALVPHPVLQHLREKVHDGIQCVLQSNGEWDSHHIPNEFKAEAVPSNWFG